MERARSWISNLALLGTSLCLAIAGAEATLRCFDPTPAYYQVWPSHLHVVLHPDPHVMPGITGEKHFRTNGIGIRGEAMPNDGRYEILAIGGSTTESLFLDDAEAWPHLLEEDLNERLGAGATWVGNVGKSGLNSRHHVIEVRELLTQHPDVSSVLIMVGINDLSYRLGVDRAFRPISEESPSVIEGLYAKTFDVIPAPKDHQTWYWPVEILARIGRLERVAVEVGTQKVYVEDHLGDMYVTWRSHRLHAAAITSELPDLSSALDEYAHNLNTIVDLAKSHGAQVIFATQPTLWTAKLPPSLEELLWMGGIGAFQAEDGHRYYAVDALEQGMALYNQRLLDVCRARGIACVDLASKLQHDTSVFYDDCHFNENGSSEVARILTEELTGGVRRRLRGGVRTATAFARAGPRPRDALGSEGRSHEALRGAR